MINTVSAWRCKCGAHIKVVGHIPKDELSTTQKAACPKCGEWRTIYGDKILSITTGEDIHVYVLNYDAA
jgi:DNA-directed RNA polymerase subunit RPC12/RpoP